MRERERERETERTVIVKTKTSSNMDIPLKHQSQTAPGGENANKKAQKEAQKIKEMHDAQLRLAIAARERQKERQAKLLAELEKGGANGDDAHAVSREMLEKMIKECAPGETFDEDVKTALLQLADDFVEEVAMQSHKLAKLRNADVIDVKDVALHLEREWDIVVPGTSGEELKPYKRPQKPGTQTQREAKVRKSMARAVEAKILLEKERRREERRMAKLQRQAQAGASGQKEEESESDDSSSDEE